MTDAELRALVRQTVARHLSPGRATSTPPPAVAPAPIGLPSASEPWAQHPSHHLYLTVVNATDACVIEPAVSCDHCGYCRSHGH